MSPEYRQKLSEILAKLDQMSADAEAMSANPADTDTRPLIESLQDLLATMRAKVEEELEEKHA